jgi:hypothetical protein
VLSLVPCSLSPWKKHLGKVLSCGAFNVSMVMIKHIVLLTVVVILISIVTAALLLQYIKSPKDYPKGNTLSVYVGVDVAYANVTAIENQINQMRNYANLIVIGCTGITENLTLRSEVCQYAYDRNLSFIIFTTKPYNQQWLQNAQDQWSSHFLGLYAWDESAGKTLDGTYGYIQEDNYSSTANVFLSRLQSHLDRIDNGTGVPLFSSDYALYWFDYKGGYDALFAEFGWNYSRQLNVALCRGAATVQGKEWGIMITWTYTHPPYIESGEQLYNDMQLAYDNGAKYIIVFDCNEEYTQGILQEEHLQAMQQFWKYAQANPRTNSSSSDRTAFVLPDDYGYGFRGPQDKIWGWPADNFTTQLCINLYSAMQQYGSKLDIIYDDQAFANYTSFYAKTLFWNGTILGE